MDSSSCIEVSMYYICILDGTFFAKMDNIFTCAKIMLELYVNFLDKVNNDIV